MPCVFNELFSSCERAATEEKHGSVPHAMLVEAASVLRQHVHLTGRDASPNRADVMRASAPSAHVIEISQASWCADTSVPSGARNSRLAAGVDGHEHVMLSVDDGGRDAATADEVPAMTLLRSLPDCERGSIPTSSSDKTFASFIGMEAYITSEAAISKLAYSCLASITEARGGIGSMSRSSVKALTASLELATILLHSGILPTKLSAIPPSFPPTSTSCNGSPVFLSRLRGAGFSSKTAPLPSDGKSGAPKDSSAFPGKRNVRTALVDALIVAAPYALTKQPYDKLRYAYISALYSAAVPRVSRENVFDISRDRMQLCALAVHGPRLLEVLRLLFSSFSISNMSPLVCEESKAAIKNIAMASINFAEQKRNATVCETREPEVDDSRFTRSQSSPTSMTYTPSRLTSGASCTLNGDSTLTDSNNLSTAQAPDKVGELCEGSDSVQLDKRDLGIAVADTAKSLSNVDDRLQMLGLCSAIARSAPLPTSSGTSATGTANTVDTSLSESTEVPVCAASGTCSEDYTRFRNYPSLVTSLGVVLHIIVSCSQAFRNAPSVIECVQQSVVPAALRTSVSGDTDVFRLSLNVLLTCCLKFGPSLVNETSMVFRHVYFRVLVSPYTSLTQKFLVLEALQKYFEEPQHLIGLFLSYDCNTNSHSIYEEMIHILGALAMVTPPVTSINVPSGTNSETRPLTAQLPFHTCMDGTEALCRVTLHYDVPEPLRRSALLILLLVADSNVQWIERFETHRSDGSVAEDSSENAALGGAGDVDVLEGDGVTDSTRAVGADNSISDDYLQVWRYKDSFRRFLGFFNDQSNPDAALKYLCESSLLSTVCEKQTEGAGDTCCIGGDLEEGPIGEPSSTPTWRSASLSQEFVAGTTIVDLEEDGVVQARRQAAFLLQNEEYLDKSVLGEFFAKSFRRTETRLIFEEWIKLHDFCGQSLDQALRLFLGGFKILGEAQVVDKTMELFAAQYCRQNPSVFSSADTAFILSFSICMLNTDAHSPHVKNKMSLDGFIRNNAGIDEGNCVDQSILKDIYDAITQNEIVLRPSSKLVRCTGGDVGASSPVKAEKDRRVRENVTSGLLQSIPILRHLAPMTSPTSDTALLPRGVNGIGFAIPMPRIREEMYREEVRVALKDVLDALHSSSETPRTTFVAATSIKHAIPMWSVTAPLLCHLLISALGKLYADAESYSPLPTSSSSANEKTSANIISSVATYMMSTKSVTFHTTLLHGLVSIVRVCCSFGNVSHTEWLLHQVAQLTTIKENIALKGKSNPRVVVVRPITYPRLELLGTLLNLYIPYGSSFTSAGWKVGYEVISLLDALGNGTEGLWLRQALKVNRPVNAEGVTPTSDNATPPATPLPPPSGSDRWFGDLKVVPNSIHPDSRWLREYILFNLRRISDGSVDLWLERLFDVTQYRPEAVLEMANGIVEVCGDELCYQRTFFLTKLFDVVTVCATVSTRLQWRELWAKANEVFVVAGKMHGRTAITALDGLRRVALTYLMREELLNYSFQREVLRPFEVVLMHNQDVPVRQKVLNIILELVQFRAAHLASGWGVVFSCLSHAAGIPEVVDMAWEVCESIIWHHVNLMKDCFSDLVFCLTAFSCTSINDRVPLCGLSYLLACGYWLQFGLEAPPPEVRDADGIALWARRFWNAEQGARACSVLGKHLVRVTHAFVPLSPSNLLIKPLSYTAKTNYQLWMALFEGIVPIVIVHSSFRVRAHALCSLWTLLSYYGPVFSEEVQDSLFSGMLQPMLVTLLKSVYTVNLDASDRRMEYRIIVYLALKGMVWACTGHPHLLSLGCSTLRALLSTIPFTVEMLQNDVIGVILRICGDLLGATNPPDTVFPAASSTTDKQHSTMLVSLAAEGWAKHTLPETKSNCHRSLFCGLLHEVRQTGLVDVVHCKWTASWGELVCSPVATTSMMALSPEMCTDSSSSLIRDTVLHCFSIDILGRLRSLLCNHSSNQEHCLLILRAIRRTMLALSFYSITTKDVRGFELLLRAGDTRTVAGEGSGSETLGMPAEYLLLAPYTCVLAEFILAFDVEPNNVKRELLRHKMQRIQVDMAHARHYCVEMHQRTMVKRDYKGSSRGSEPCAPICQAATTVPAGGIDIPSKSARPSGIGEIHNFCSVFRCGGRTITAQRDFTGQEMGPELRERIHQEWIYLTHLLSLRFLLMLGEKSVLLSSVPPAALLSFVPLLPSALEEASVDAFSASCWAELDLHIVMPDEGVLLSCVKFLQCEGEGFDRVRKGQRE